MSHQPWTVVLAAGAGRRLAEVTGGVPKQFWRPLGGASLLELTIERFAPLAPRTRTVVIVDDGHREHVAKTAARDELGTVIVQPEDRGTAAGVLLALTPVLESDPDSVIVVTPSDHGVVDDREFRRGVEAAVHRAATLDEIVLLGVEPFAPRHDFGWISLDDAPAPGSFGRVRSFVEKPASSAAVRLFREGAVWNTMVLAARARVLWQLYIELLPSLAYMIAAVVCRPPGRRAAYLAAIYPTLPRTDFSRDVLERASVLTAYVLPASLGWTDLGTPDRLAVWRHQVACTGRRAPAAPAA